MYINLFMFILLPRLNFLPHTHTNSWFSIKKQHSYLFVPRVGVEPTVAMPLHPKCSPYTNSGTEAYQVSSTGLTALLRNYPLVCLLQSLVRIFKVSSRYSPNCFSIRDSGLPVVIQSLFCCE